MFVNLDSKVADVGTGCTAEVGSSFEVAAGVLISTAITLEQSRLKQSCREI